MELGTFIGSILGITLLTLAVTLGSPESLMPFVSTPSLLIVFGGSMAAVMTAFGLKVFLKTSSYIRKSFAQSDMNPQKTAETIITLSIAARREGLLSLENKLAELEDRFLADSLQLAVDGLSPQDVKTIVRAKIDAVNVRHQCGRNVILNYAKFAPAFGMIGTLIGLVLMLTRMNTETVGPGMAVAVLTTLYGAVAANLFFIPVAEKLKQLHEAEVSLREMTLKGVLAIQAGEHPRIIELKLQTYVDIPRTSGLNSSMPTLEPVTIPAVSEDESEQSERVAA
ncbi:flagellar motor protein MotP [Planctomycetales bacterium]|nr:flagellar motor protein MotP [Planctomycetales bacterium]